MERQDIIRWLNNYHELVNYYATASPFRISSGNYGGLEGKDKKIILDSAIAAMPEELRICVVSRWIDLNVKETLEKYNISDSTFYRRTARGVTFILEYIERRKEEYLEKHVDIMQ